MRYAREAFLVSTLVFFGFLGGCETVETSAPTVQSLPAGKARDLTSLQKGREIFLQRCAECHTLQPIRKYSTERWEKIIATMAPRARLDSADRSALEAYIMAARRSYPE